MCKSLSSCLYSQLGDDLAGKVFEGQEMILAGFIFLLKAAAVVAEASSNIYYKPGVGCGLYSPLKAVSMCWIELWVSGFETVAPCTVVVSPGHLVGQSRERQLKARGGNVNEYQFNMIKATELPLSTCEARNCYDNCKDY